MSGRGPSCARSEAKRTRRDILRYRLLILALLTGLLFGAFFVARAQADAGLSRGLDTSLRPTLAQYRAMHAASYEFMGRYLPIPGGSKIYPVTRAELKDARAAGVAVFLIFEWCDYRHYPTSYAQGRIDGQLAQRALKGLGLYRGTAVYFSLDRGHASIAQALEYFRGVRESMPLLGVGCYGSKAQLLALQKAGLITYLWYAPWTDGNNLSPFGWGAHLYQSTRYVYPGGVACDQNWSLVAEFGQVR
jgi:hypothetical protein